MGKTESALALLGAIVEGAIFDPEKNAYRAIVPPKLYQEAMDLKRAAWQEIALSTLEPKE